MDLVFYIKDCSGSFQLGVAAVDGALLRPLEVLGDGFPGVASAGVTADAGGAEPECQGLPPVQIHWSSTPPGSHSKHPSHVNVVRQAGRREKLLPFLVLGDDLPKIISSLWLAVFCI